MYLIACLETDGSNQSPALHEYRDQQRKLIRTTVAVDHRHAMLRSRRTTVALFDVKMPELDGNFIARMFRSVLTLCRPAVIERWKALCLEIYEKRAHGTFKENSDVVCGTYGRVRARPTHAHRF